MNEKDTKPGNEAISVETVGGLAGADYRKAEVFRKYGIDFCCGGGQTISEAARQAGIAEAELRSALDAAVSASLRPETDWANWTAGELAEYIISTHHQYVRDSLPVIIEYAQKVAGHHGDQHPGLLALNRLVRQEAHDLFIHLDREEMGLFPVIESLSGLSKQTEATEQGSLCSAPGPGNSRASNHGFVRQAVSRMMNEHSHSGQSLENFRKLTNNYTPPQGACNSFRYLYEKLKEFDLDLQQHIHLENNILFPNALALLD